MIGTASLLVFWLMAGVLRPSFGIDVAQRSSRPSSTVLCWKDIEEVKNPDVRAKKMPVLPASLASATVKRPLVALKVCINESGEVPRSIVVTSSGNRKVDQFYQDTVSRWKLKPVIRNGKPTPSVANVSVTWNIR
jgi:TonB family protein